MVDKSDAVAIPDDQVTAVALAADLNGSMPSLFTDDALAAMSNLTDAMAAFGDSPPESISDYGTGFDVLDDKRTLIGVPFLAVEWRFNPGKYGDVFVSAAVVAEDGRKLIINDGSPHGIAGQFQQVTRKRVAERHQSPRAGLLCKDGLRMSEYDYVDADGKSKPATTFYLAN